MHVDGADPRLTYVFPLAGGEHCEPEPHVFVGTHCQLSSRQVNGPHTKAFQ